MLYYYATYARDIEEHPDQQATGLIIKGTRRMEAIHYDHRAQRWRYNPESIGAWMASMDNEYKRQLIKRDEAELIAMRITEGTDPLPSEETILETFAQAKRIREESGQEPPAQS